MYAECVCNIVCGRVCTVWYVLLAIKHHILNIVYSPCPPPCRSPHVLPSWLCPYVPQSTTLSRRMLAYVGVTAKDHVLDIGSGDGRVLVEAAALTGCRCTGIEIDAGLVDASVASAEVRGVGEQCTFVAADAVRVLQGWLEDEGGAGDGNKGGGSAARGEEGGARGGILGSVASSEGREEGMGGNALGSVTVIALYLIPEAMRAIRDIVHRLWSRGGVRIVTNSYHWDDWPYDHADPAFGLWRIDARPVGQSTS